MPILPYYLFLLVKVKNTHSAANILIVVKNTVLSLGDRLPAVPLRLRPPHGDPPLLCLRLLLGGLRGRGGHGRGHQRGNVAVRGADGSRRGIRKGHTQGEAGEQVRYA